VKGKVKHGLSYTPEYRAWQTMRNRCTSPNSPAWEDYGGRGITVCERWLNSPANFIADMGPRPPGYELDRIDNDGPYSPENCRWTTRRINDRNRRSNVYLEAFGERKTKAEWCEQFGIATDTLSLRISKQGLSVEEALTRPIKEKRSARQAAKKKVAA